MAFEVEISPQAEDDLFSIYVYVAEGGGLTAADAYDTRIRLACLSLAAFPRRGTPHGELALGLRSIPFERRATIYYRVTGEAVEIVRVLHRGREPARDFG